MCACMRGVVGRGQSLHIQNFSQFFIFLFFPCFMRCLHRTHTHIYTHTRTHTESETVWHKLRRRHAWGLLIALFRRLSAPNPQQQRHSSFYSPPPSPCSLSLLCCPAWHYVYDACNLIHAFIYFFMRCLSMN